jgi:hypothetical protein
MTAQQQQSSYSQKKKKKRLTDNVDNPISPVKSFDVHHFSWNDLVKDAKHTHTDRLETDGTTRTKPLLFMTALGYTHTHTVAMCNRLPFLFSFLVF